MVRILLLSLVLGPLALAYPNVGDRVKWQGDILEQGGQKTPLEISKEVVEFSPKKQKWIVKYTAKVGDQITTEIVEVDQLYTPKEYQKILTQCERDGGILSQTKTQAGSFQTCRIKTLLQGQMIEKSWGDIPFGVVSRITTDTTNQSFDLRSLIQEL